MCGDDPWLAASRSFDEPTLSAVIRGLVLYSMASGFSGGSASPVICLYADYRQRFPTHEPELTRWITHNRQNDYEPFGTTLHGDAHTWQEFQTHCVERAQKRATHLALEELRRQEAASLRQLSDADDATERLPSAVRRGDLAAVKALLAKGANWRRAGEASGSLISLAESNGREAVAAFLRAQGID